MAQRLVYNKVYSAAIWAKVNPDNKALLDDFVVDMRSRKLSPNTIRQYFTDLRAFFCYLYTDHNNCSILELSRKDFKRYALKLIDEYGVSNSRRNAMMASIKSLLSYAEDDEDLEYPDSAARKIESLGKEPIRKHIFLTDDEVMKLYDALIGREMYQHATLLMLAYESAARRAELAQVFKYTFQDRGRHNTNEVVGKGRKKFSLIYFEPTRRAALAWLEQRGDDEIDDLFVAGYRNARHEALPVDVYRMFLDMRDLLDLPGDDELEFSTHDLRHTALNNYYNGTHHVCRDLGKPGYPTQQLKSLAHHNSVATTESYLPDISTEEIQGMFDIEIK